MRVPLFRRPGPCATPPQPPVAIPVVVDDLGPSIRFATAGARRRIIPLDPGPIGVAITAPSGRLTPGRAQRMYGETQFVTRGGLPETVTCGAGYLEILAFVDGGIVVNEVRTFGDEVMAEVLPGPSYGAIA